jgi:DNA helicase II / ATP-dependent DNA helicase PcrA
MTNFAAEELLIDTEGGGLAGSLKPLPRRQNQSPTIKRRYSVTADILSYRRCRRQYGFFGRRGYVPAHSGQLFFGTVIHKTLDRAYQHFRGLIEGAGPGLPTSEDIEAYFEDAAIALEEQGVRYMSKRSRAEALAYVQRFNRQHGKRVYRRIVDTEHHLQMDKGNYILHGVVDVIARAGNSTENWADHEIWDYKGSVKPRPRQDGDAYSRSLKNYEFQMRVYAHLYQLRNGVLPRKAVLWFLGEKLSKNQQYEVPLDEKLVGEAVAAFEQTVVEIEGSIDRNDWSSIKPIDAPEPATCDACDLRWNCSGVLKPYRLRTL